MQLDDLPLVSIALCTYNGKRFLATQVNSILAQTYRQIEFIIVDDCSADGTKGLLEAYKEQDPRVKVYFNEVNLGYAKNFERAVTLCTGKYIALCDQDDIWMEDKISILVEAIQGNVLVYHDSDFIDNEDRRIGTDSMATRYRMYDGESCLPIILSNCISGHAALFDSELVKYILPFNEEFYHDWWISYVAFNVGKVKFVNQILVHYRQHEQSITDNLKLRVDADFKNPTVRNIQRISLNVEWLKFCADFQFNREPGVINEAYYLLANLAQGKERRKSFNFLVKHFDLLFYICYKPKSYLSKLNMVRKICYS